MKKVHKYIGFIFFLLIIVMGLSTRYTDASLTLGALNVDSSGILNLGTTTATSINIAGNNINTIFGGNVGIGTVTPNYVGLTDTKKVLTLAGTSDHGALEFANTIGDSATNVGLIYFSMPTNTAGNGKPVAEIVGSSAGVVANDKGGYLRFYTKVDGGALAERLRINTSGGVGLGNAYRAVDPGTNNLIVEGNVGIGVTNPGAKLDINSDSFILKTAKTPASASATCTTGTIAWDSDYVYVCVATNTWKRSALTTW
ncbi:MAG: hypothetical protein WC783_02385 [Candidatus Paceibacterota bacterium]|jgi:hypothetical protein